MLWPDAARFVSSAVALHYVKECTIGSLRQDADRYRPSNLEIGMGRRPASDLQTLEMENEYGEPRTTSD